MICYLSQIQIKSNQINLFALTKSKQYMIVIIYSWARQQGKMHFMLS